MGSDATLTWGFIMRLGRLYSHDATDARSAPSTPHTQPRLYTRSQLGRFRSHTSSPSTLLLTAAFPTTATTIVRYGRRRSGLTRSLQGYGHEIHNHWPGA